MASWFYLIKWSLHFLGTFQPVFISEYVRPREPSLPKGAFSNKKNRGGILQFRNTLDLTSISARHLTEDFDFLHQRFLAASCFSWGIISIIILWGIIGQKKPGGSGGLRPGPVLAQLCSIVCDVSKKPS